MATFIPDIQVQQIKVPFFEDQKDNIPGRGTHKAIAVLHKEIEKLLGQLNAYNVLFVPGKYDGTPKRYGFQIHFVMNGNKGRMDCVALPMREEFPVRKDRALAQALYLIRDKLQALAFAYAYEPGSIPLLPYLIGDTGETVTEAMIAHGMLPQLAAGGQNGNRG